MSEGVLPVGPRYLDAGAAATGELVFELAVANGWTLTEAAARGFYVAILTDTGGFRFSNTRPRTLRVAAELLEAGVDPEQIYLEVYARAPEGRPRLFAEALQTLVVEPEYGSPGSRCRPAPSSASASPPTTSRAWWSSRARSKACGWPCCSAR